MSVDCKLTWSEWSDCTKACGGGTKKRIGRYTPATIYWWYNKPPQLSLLWNTSQPNYYYNGEWNSFDYFKDILPSDHKTSTTGRLDIENSPFADQNIHIDFEAGTVSNIRIRGEPSNSPYAFWTGSQWEGQIMANGQNSMNRYAMEDDGNKIWTNNDGTYAELNIVPPLNATQFGCLNGDGKKYILVELT